MAWHNFLDKSPDLKIVCRDGELSCHKDTIELAMPCLDTDSGNIKLDISVAHGKVLLKACYDPDNLNDKGDLKIAIALFAELEVWTMVETLSKRLAAQARLISSRKRVRGDDVDDTLMTNANVHAEFMLTMSQDYNALPHDLFHALKVLWSPYMQKVEVVHFKWKRINLDTETFNNISFKGDVVAYQKDKFLTFDIICSYKDLKLIDVIEDINKTWGNFVRFALYEAP